MLRYLYLISSLPTLAIDVEEKHEAICRHVAAIADHSPRQMPKLRPFKQDFFVNMQFPAKTLSLVMVNWRLMMRDPKIVAFERGSRFDSNSYDDSMDGHILVGHPEHRWSLERLATLFLPALLDGLDAYRAEVLPHDLFSEDIRGTRMPDTQTATRDSRYSSSGPSAISFYDERFCRSAYQASPEQVLERVRGEVVDARLFRVRGRQGILMRTVPEYATADVVRERRESLRERILASTP